MKVPQIARGPCKSHGNTVDPTRLADPVKTTTEHLKNLTYADCVEWVTVGERDLTSNSQPRTGTFGFILHTQKYSPPMVGLKATPISAWDAQSYRCAYYALHISAKDNAMSSMKRLQIFEKSGSQEKRY